MDGAAIRLSFSNGNMWHRMGVWVLLLRGEEGGGVRSVCREERVAFVWEECVYE